MQTTSDQRLTSVTTLSTQSTCVISGSSSSWYVAGMLRSRDQRWSRDHFFGLGLGLGLTVIGLGLGLGLIRFGPVVSNRSFVMTSVSVLCSVSTHNLVTMNILLVKKLSSPLIIHRLLFQICNR